MTAEPREVSDCDSVTGEHLAALASCKSITGRDKPQLAASGRSQPWARNGADDGAFTLVRVSYGVHRHGEKGRRDQSRTRVSRNQGCCCTGGHVDCDLKQALAFSSCDTF